MINDSIDEQGKVKATLAILFSPILLYFVVWGIIGAPIKLWAFYTTGETWSKEYQLIEVDSCSSDYEFECSRLIFNDIQTDEIYKIRWYDDKNSITKLNNIKVNLVGTQGPFGAIVNGIEW